MRIFDALIFFGGMLLPGAKPLARLRARWAAPGEGSAWGATWYFEHLRNRLEPKAVVDDKSWSDLEFPAFFKAIDTATTPVGRQCLYAQLRTYEYSAVELEARYSSYRALVVNQEQRERLQLALRPLEGDESAYIADLLVGPDPDRVRFGRFLLPWTLFTVAAVATGLLHWIPLWGAAIPPLINAIVAFRADAKLSHQVSSLLALTRMLDVARRITALQRLGSFALLDRLAFEARKRDLLKAQLRPLALLDRLRSVHPASGLVVLANVFFLLKLTAYARSINRFAATRSEWLSTYTGVGSIDAAVTVAGFIHRYPSHCRPAHASSTIEIINGYHAFISVPVKNSVTLVDRSALISGSNMAGKTTFIKMIAMNAVLGHTLGICLADRAVLPRSPVKAVIKGDQSVLQGKSRYFAEAEAIRECLAEAANGSCRVFVLDEPFSGTNTAERIAITKAVIDAVAASSQVLVTTHDIELQRLLGSRFELFHFQEDPTVEGFFDYLLHPGAGTRRNAIRVLERLGYPPEVIQDALQTVSKLDEPKAAM